MMTLLQAVLAVTALGIACTVSAQTLNFEGETGAAILLRLAQQERDRDGTNALPATLALNSSSAALAKLCRGEIAVAGTARRIVKAESDACAQHQVIPIEVPLAMDAIVVVANPANTWLKQVSVEELKRAWQDAPGKPVTWKQVNGVWPDRPLKLYGPMPKLGLAGSYRAVLQAGVKETPALRTDITGTEVLSVVVEGVARDQDALGVLDWATYNTYAKRVRAVPLEVQGRSVLPSARTLADGSYAAFSYPVFLYTSAKAAKDPGASNLLAYLLAHAPRLADEAGLQALDQVTYEQARRRLANP